VLKNCLLFVLFTGFLIFGCSKNKDESFNTNEASDTTPVQQETNTEKSARLAEEAEKLRAASVEREKAKQPNIVSIPMDFKGFQLGEQSVNEIRKKFKGLVVFTQDNFKIAACTDTSNDHKCSRISNLTLVNEPLSNLSFHFSTKNSNKLALVGAQLDSKYFENLRDALIEKYGEPTLTESYPLTNKLTGVESNYFELTWKHVNGDHVLKITNHKQDGSDFTPIVMLILQSNSLFGANQEEQSKTDI
jgi:hypothetical protein